MLPRTLFSAEHELYREQVRKFVEREIAPHHAKWEKDHIVPRSVWLAAGEAGLLLPAIPDEYGGCGGDRLHSAIVMEELARAGATGPGFSLHSDIVAPVHPGLWHRGAEAPLFAAHGEGRDHRRHRHDGAGCRFRFTGGADKRAAAG